MCSLLRVANTPVAQRMGPLRLFITTVLFAMAVFAGGEGPVQAMGSCGVVMHTAHRGMLPRSVGSGKGAFIPLPDPSPTLAPPVGPSSCCDQGAHPQGVKMSTRPDHCPREPLPLHTVFCFIHNKYGNRRAALPPQTHNLIWRLTSFNRGILARTARV